MFRKLIGWLNLADLDDAREEASMRIMARYARGNTSFQDGRSLNQEDLIRLSAAADQAMNRLRHALHR